MEKMGDWEQKNLINELTQGREVAKQLQIHLNMSSSSQETQSFLVQKILASYEKSLSMLNCSTNCSVGDQPQNTGLPIGTSESPHSLGGSPRSEDSDRDLKDQELKDAARKRKTMPRWTEQVRVTPGTGLEGHLDDGFSWRKYGQKDILGAKHPRGYYRCSHRNVHGCLATKQVQRSDGNPTIFDITYRGKHTCNQASNMNPPPPLPPTENQEPNTTIDLQQQSQELLFNLRKGLKVTITEDSDILEKPFPSNFLHFPVPSNVINDQNQIFSSPSMIDNNDINLMGNFSPNFISPAGSGSNNVFASPNGTSSNLQGNMNFQNSDSEIAEIISAASTSATNSPTVGLDFPFGNVDFDPNFTFDNPGFFS